MATDFNRVYNQNLKEFEQYLNDFCANLNAKPDLLNSSLKYTLLLGGKRFRPVLMMGVGKMFGVDKQDILPYALALELIHTYSLIHDDLPSMDNDDYRRGKLTNHKIFGEANAILAGDGLLNTAYSLLFEQCYKGKNYITAAKTLCDFAGIYGMICGQSADILHEKDDKVDLDTLNFIYKNKTSKLIMGAVLVPSILSGGTNYAELMQFATDLGIMFQIVDDILDVEGNFDLLGKSIGKDTEYGKYSYVNLYGLDNAKLQADYYYSKCLKLIDGINCDTSFLRGVVNYVRKRMK